MSTKQIAISKVDFDEMGLIKIQHAKTEITMDRKTELLHQVLEMFRQCDESNLALSPFEVELFYDNLECDGHALYHDIIKELEK